MPRRTNDRQQLLYAITRQADVAWIEQLHATYRDLPLDEVVAVARRGLTPAARTMAAA